jgi:hypothetical protein
VGKYLKLKKFDKYSRSKREEVDGVLGLAGEHLSLLIEKLFGSKWDKKRVGERSFSRMQIIYTDIKSLCHVRRETSIQVRSKNKKG